MEERRGKSTNKNVGEVERDLKAHLAEEEAANRKANPELYEKFDRWEKSLSLEEDSGQQLMDLGSEGKLK